MSFLKIQLMLPQPRCFPYSSQHCNQTHGGKGLIEGSFHICTQFETHAHSNCIHTLSRTPLDPPFIHTCANPSNVAVSLSYSTITYIGYLYSYDASSALDIRIGICPQRPALHRSRLRVSHQSRNEVVTCDRKLPSCHSICSV